MLQILAGMPQSDYLCGILFAVGIVQNIFKGSLVGSFS
jgi:hypothetical protein